MQYLNLTLSLCKSPAFINSELEARGIWVGLLAYCCSQENAGRIIDCKKWTDRAWQQTVGSTRKAMLEKSELWRFDGADCVVFGYPEHQEKTTIKLRERGREAILKRWEKARGIPSGIPSGNTKPNTKDKVREDKINRPAPLKPRVVPLKTGLHYPLPHPEESPVDSIGDSEISAAMRY